DSFDGTDDFLSTERQGLGRRSIVDQLDDLAQPLQLRQRGGAWRNALRHARTRAKGNRAVQGKGTGKGTCAVPLRRNELVRHEQTAQRRAVRRAFLEPACANTGKSVDEAAAPEVHDDGRRRGHSDVFAEAAVCRGQTEGTRSPDYEFTRISVVLKSRPV